MILTGTFSPEGHHTFVLPSDPGIPRSTSCSRQTRAAWARWCEPIFIVGSPRSGTSILTWCLGQHPNILVQEESNWLGSFAHSLQSCFEVGSARGERSQLSAMGIRREEMFQLMGAAVDQLIFSHHERLEKRAREAAIKKPEQVNPAFRFWRNESDSKDRWVDGTPENSFCITGLRHLFPRAKFIHLVRDVESVVKSLLKFGHNVVDNEEDAYRYWLRTVRACFDAERAYGSEVVTRIYYRDLVQAPEETLRQCLAFLGEPFVPYSLEPLKTRINSSHVPPGFDPVDSGTDPKLRETAQQLSRSLLAEENNRCCPDPATVSGLEEEFVARSRHLARAGRDLQWALRRLANAERELWPLRGMTPVEAAGELVRSATPYHARIAVVLRSRDEFPYLNGREPMPVWLPQNDGDEEAFLGQLRALQASGARFLLVSDGLLDCRLQSRAVRELIQALYKPVRARWNWSLFAS